MKQQSIFGDDSTLEQPVIRTLGLWQPFASMILHGKTETRKVRKGMKPPFPHGIYLIYSTQKVTPPTDLTHWCTAEQQDLIFQTLRDEPTAELRGYALAIMEVKGLAKMTRHDEHHAYIKHVEWPEHDVWMFAQENVQRIEPFEFKFGKQGVGILPESERQKIVILQ